jgi:flagellar motor protein MotB
MRALQSELHDARGRAGALDKRARAAVAARERSSSELAAATAGKQRAREQAEQVAQRLRSALQAEEAEVVRDGGRVVLLVGDRQLFKSGKEELSDDGTRLLIRVAQVVDSYPEGVVKVRGHGDVDQQQSRRRRKRSSAADPWTLAARRAIAVVRFFEEKRRMEPKRLEAIAVGKSEVSEEEDEGKKRAIEIVFLPAEP